MGGVTGCEDESEMGTVTKVEGEKLTPIIDATLISDFMCKEEQHNMHVMYDK